MSGLRKWRLHYLAEGYVKLPAHAVPAWCLAASHSWAALAARVVEVILLSQRLVAKFQMLWLSPSHGLALSRGMSRMVGLGR